MFSGFLERQKGDLCNDDVLQDESKLSLCLKEVVLCLN